MALERWIEGQRQKGDPAAVEMGQTLLSLFGEIALPQYEAVLAQPVTSSPKETTSTSEIDLTSEWERQAQKYIELGFHTELGMSEEDYLSSLPKFEQQPEAFKVRFDIPVLVETRIDLLKQVELAGIINDIGHKGIIDPSLRRENPTSPYTTWMQDGKKNLGKDFGKVIRDLKKDEVGATLYEGVALVISNPDILEDHKINLPGTKIFPTGFRAGFGYVPMLIERDGKFLLTINAHLDLYNKNLGWASCGKQ